MVGMVRKGMEYKYHRAIGISALTILLTLMMFNADYLFHKAFAFSTTSVNNSSITHGIARVGNQIWVGSTTSDTINIYASGSFTLLATVSSNNPQLLHVYNNRVYVFSATGPVVEEWEPNTITYTPNLLRTSATLTSCSLTISYNEFDDDKFVCGTGAGNTIRMLDLDTFTATVSSTTNTGANACNTAWVQAYDAVSDTVFVLCDTTNNVVAIQGSQASGTPDYGTGKTITSTSYADFNPVTNKLLIIGGGVAPVIYDVVLGTSIIIDETLSGYGTSVGTGITHDQANRFIWLDVTQAQIRITDSEGQQIIGTSFASNPDNQIFSYSSLKTYVAGGGSGAFHFVEIDMTGLASGGGGGGGDQPPAASICYIDTNADGIANLVYRDTTGPAGVPDGMCDGSVLDFPENDPADCTANGLARLIASLLGIDCDDDPNPATNGIGMLYMLFLGLFVMGVIFAGSRKFNFDMASIHPAVWLFFAVGITGFSWQVGWVDSIVFYAMIIVCAGVGAFGLYQKFRNNGG